MPAVRKAACTRTAESGAVPSAHFVQLRNRLDGATFLDAELYGELLDGEALLFWAGLCDFAAVLAC